MKFNKTILALGIAALSAIAVAQPNPYEHNNRHQQQPPQPGQPVQPGGHHNPNDRALNPQPLPPFQQHGERHDHDRDFRTDRDYRRWNDHDHRRNYETHRDHVRELRLGMRKREVLDLPWWRTPLFTRDNGPFDTYIYADGRDKCVLSFKFNRLAEIDCN